MSTIQLELRLEQSQARPLNLVGVVYSIMRDGEWRTLYQLQREVEAVTGEWHSDAGLSSRIRDLRKPQYGAHSIESRQKVGKRTWEYRLTA